MKKLLFLFIVVFGCEMNERVNSEYQIDYLNHNVVDGRLSGRIVIDISLRNRSSSPINSLKFLFESKLSDGTTVIQEFKIDTRMEVNSIMTYRIVNTGYVLEEENEVFLVEDIKSMTLVKIIMYDEDGKELGRATFPSIVVA